jgi:ATP-dependent exoDNAse (exonuclease V) alpha subunit
MGSARMAIYHFSAAAPIARSNGRSATAAAAYCAAEKIADKRTGVVFDYRCKRGVDSAVLLLPGGKSEGRAEFWNRVETHHKRGDAVVAREITAALPRELSAERRRQLAHDFARDLINRYGVAVDVALHEPRTVTDHELKKNPGQFHEIDPETGRRHNGNWHAHFLISACYVSVAGELGAKVVALDPIHCQRHKIQNMTDRERPRWTELVNDRLREAGIDARVDHRALEAQGIDRAPTEHLGPKASDFERRTGKASKRRRFIKRRAAERQAEEAERRLVIAELDRIELEQREICHAAFDTAIEVRGALAQPVTVGAQHRTRQREFDEVAHLAQGCGRDDDPGLE